MLSVNRPFPSMLNLAPWRSRSPVKALPVNWLPRSVLKIFGLPLLNAFKKTLPVFNVVRGFLIEATVPKTRASE